MRIRYAPHRKNACRWQVTPRQLNHRTKCIGRDVSRELFGLSWNGPGELSDKCATSTASAHQSFRRQLIVTGDDGVAIHAELLGQQARARQWVAGRQTSATNTLCNSAGKLQEQRQIPRRIESNLEIPATHGKHDKPDQMSFQNRPFAKAPGLVRLALRLHRKKVWPCAQSHCYP